MWLRTEADFPQYLQLPKLRNTVYFIWERKKKWTKISCHCDFNVQKAGAAGLKYSMEYERVYSPTDGVISHYEGLHPVKVQATQEKD